MSITRDLSNFYVSQSFYRLIQLDPNDNKSLVNGVGNFIGDIRITGSLEFSDKLRTILPDTSQISIYIDKSTKKPIIENETAYLSASLGVVQFGEGVPISPPYFGGESGLGTFYLDVISGDLYYYTISTESSSSVIGFVVGNMLSSSFSLSHNFNFTDVLVSTYEAYGNYEAVYPDVYYSSENSVLLDFSPNILQTNEISASILNYNPTYQQYLIGNGINNSFTLTHGFNTRDLIVLLRESGSLRELVTTDVGYTTDSTVSLDFLLPPNTNEYIATLIPFTSSIANTYSQLVGDGINRDYLINHSLQTRNVFVMLRENQSPYKRVYPAIYHTNKNYITLGFNNPVQLNKYTVNVMGFPEEDSPEILSLIVGNGIESTFNLNHNFDFKDVLVSAYENTNPFEQVYADIYYNSENSFEIDFSPNILQNDQISVSILNYGNTYEQYLVGDGINDVYTISHGFNTRNLIVLLRETGASNQLVISDINFTTQGTISIGFATPPDTNEYIATLIPFTSSIANTHSQLIGDGINNAFTVAHTLNSRNIFVSVRENQPPYKQVYPSIYHTTLNDITLEFDSVVQLNQYVVNILG